MTPSTLSDAREALASRLRDYHAVSIEEVLDTVAYLREAGDSVIAGGSLAVGLGNRLSDLDLVIVGDKTIESSRVPLEHFVGSLRVDAWVMSQALIDEVFQRAEQGLTQAGRLDDLFANVDDEVNLKLLHRVAFGIVLDGPAVQSSASRDHTAIAKDVVVREYLERTREHAFLAQLAAARDRPMLAAINARDAIEEALHAVITARGVPFTGHKWLQERLASDAFELDQCYEPFATLPPPAAEWRSFVRDAIDRCETLTGVSLKVDDVAPCCSWINSELSRAQIGPTSLLLSVKAGGLWELDESEANIWRDLAGGDRDEQRREWRCSELTPDQTALCFDLYEKGLLLLHWSEGIQPAQITLEASRD